MPPTKTGHINSMSRHAIHWRFKMHRASRLNSHSSEIAAHQEGKSPFGINRVDESLENSTHHDAVDLSNPHVLHSTPWASPDLHIPSTVDPFFLRVARRSNVSPV